MQLNQILSNEVLQEVHRIGAGYIYNDYSGNGKWGKIFNVLHRADCHKVLRMNVNYPKYYFDTLAEAEEFINNLRGNNWKKCDDCLHN